MSLCNQEIKKLWPPATCSWSRTSVVHEDTWRHALRWCTPLQSPRVGCPLSLCPSYPDSRGHLRCQQLPFKKLWGPPPWLGCCTLPIHIGALCKPLIDRTSIILCNGLLGWGISHLGNLMTLVIDAETCLLTAVNQQHYYVLRPLFTHVTRHLRPPLHDIPGGARAGLVKT